MLLKPSVCLDSNILLGCTQVHILTLRCVHPIGKNTASEMQYAQNLYRIGLLRRQNFGGLIGTITFDLLGPFCVQLPAPMILKQTLL